MEDEQAAHHLLNVLEERGLDVDLDKILHGFEDDDTKGDAAAWVQEYLHEDTLLTKEELELYQTLRKKGLLAQYESEGDPTRPILDHEVTAAIESLQSSTEAIDKQCRVLQSQKEALKKLTALEQPSLDMEHARNERRRKEGQEKARLDVAVDDVVTIVSDQLAETQKEVDTEKSTLTSYLSERLASDDQILSRLPGIVSAIVTEVQASDEEKSIKQWCKAIVSFRTSEIKARVDNVYLESLATSLGNDEPDTSDEEFAQRKAALQAELEELHTEIASVAEMVVEHELVKPLNDMKDRKDREVAQARSAWLNYVLSTLDYMSKRLETVHTNTKDANGFQHALSHISGAASKRMPELHAARPTPLRRGTSASSSAFTPMIKLKPTKVLDLPVALQDALRQTGVPFNQDSIERLQDSLVSTQLEREQRLRDHYQSVSTSAQDKLAERSSKADADWRVIADALYKNSPFQQVNLSNAKLDDELRRIERDLERGDRDLLEVQGNQLSRHDPKVRAFIAKYGR